MFNVYNLVVGDLRIVNLSKKLGFCPKLTNEVKSKVKKERRGLLEFHPKEESGDFCRFWPRGAFGWFM